MHPFPHHYQVSARAKPEGDVLLSTDGTMPIASQVPVEFGGLGGHWSPETLLTAAVADCFVLGFRAIAAASKVEFVKLEVSVEGVLDRVERTMKFTEMKIKANLVVPEGVDHGRAEKLLLKAEESCLVTNSLNTEVSLETSVSEG